MASRRCTASSEVSCYNPDLNQNLKNKNDLQAKIDKNQGSTNQLKRKTRGHTYINNSKMLDLGKDPSRLELPTAKEPKEEKSPKSPKKQRGSIYRSFLNPESAGQERDENRKFTSNPLIRNPSATKKSTVKLDNGEVGVEDRNKFLTQLSSHADTINSRMGDLLKRSERLNDNAKRLSNQIDAILRE